MVNLAGNCSIMGNTYWVQPPEVLS